MDNIDFILMNPPQLPTHMLHSSYKSTPAYSFKNGGTDGFDIFRILLSKMTAITKSPIYITLSPILDIDLFFTLAESYGFSSEYCGQDHIEIPDEILYKMNKSAFDIIERKGSYVKVFKLIKK